MKIAVLGAGISGIATAYLLKQDGHDVTVFEAGPRLGGNAYTMDVLFGGQQYLCDIGVSDFNFATYRHTGAMMDQLGVAYDALLDATSWYTADGKIAWTLDGQFGTEMPAHLRQQYNRFAYEAPRDMLDPAYFSLSIAQYLQGKGYSQDFAKQIIIPRVHAMYFADNNSPGAMPLLAAMHYFVLQCGFRVTGSQRSYFTNGSREWINKLVAASGATYYTNTPVQIEARPSPSGGITVFGHYGSLETYDRVVIATHAYNARQLFRGGVGMTQAMDSVLSTFRYVDSVAVVHTDASVICPNPSAWRTFNVLMQECGDNQICPYTISSVVTLHRGEAALNAAADQHYFGTVNPIHEVREDLVLKTVEGRKAMVTFPHNVLSVSALMAQNFLWKHVQGENNVYFTGGWTLGVGLHEECWISAMQVRDLFRNPGAPIENTYDISRGPAKYAPQYLRDVIA